MNLDTVIKVANFANGDFKDLEFIGMDGYQGLYSLVFYDPTQCDFVTFASEEDYTTYYNSRLDSAICRQLGKEYTRKEELRAWK